jgi:hypothetical protein
MLGRLRYLIVGLLVGALIATPAATYLPLTAVTPTAAPGTTVTKSGIPYVVVIDKAAFVCAATTCDVTIATLPAKSKVTGVVADLTTVFACTATCTSATLSFTVGASAGGTQYLLSQDADAAIGTFGIAAAQTGASLAANLIQSGDIPSWSGATTVSIRLTSLSGNIGSGSVTNLSQGSVTLYVLVQFYGA